MFKKVWIGIVLAGMLALGVVGVAFAQDPPESDEGVCPFGGGCGGLGGGFGMGGFGYHGTMPGIIAEELGMTLDDLYAVLDEGQSIADVAAEQGVSLEDLVAALVARRAEDLNQAVADGYLTQEQADLMLEEMTEHLGERLETMGIGGYDGGCGMRGGGYGMQGGGGGYRGGRGMHGGRWGSDTAGRRSISTTI
ncbi:MAG: hypothetical protein JXA89_18025 [Anaerolineae bacterium]|nr:hypothetical protein [Anaerolineae bacterium]